MAYLLASVPLLGFLPFFLLNLLKQVKNMYYSLWNFFFAIMDG